MDVLRSQPSFVARVLQRAKERREVYRAVFKPALQTALPRLAEMDVGGVRGQRLDFVLAEAQRYEVRGVQTIGFSASADRSRASLRL